MYIDDIPIPEVWPPLIRKAILHAMALARYTMLGVHAHIHSGDSWDLRMASEVQRRDDEIAMLREELRITQTRLDKIPARNRPHFQRHERLAVLALKAARGWNLKQAAKAFALCPETIARWMSELETYGADSLVQTPEPIDKYPEFVAAIAARMTSVASCLGRRKIAEYFARSGLHLAATTIGRHLKQKGRKPQHPTPPPDDGAAEAASRTIKSRRPNHTWLVDLTTVPIGKGFWCPWSPLSLPQVWPFCYWVCIILDHFSRRIVGFALFRKQPTSREVTDAVEAAIVRAGKTPKYIITDKGTQFFAVNARPENRKQHHYAQWCKAHRIKPRFGAVGKYGSIAIIERFMRTLKDECTRRILVPYGFDHMRDELGAFITWYNEHRPNMALDARTPGEVYDHAAPAPKLCVLPRSKAPPLKLTVSFFADRRHLPIFRIDKAA